MRIVLICVLMLVLTACDKTNSEIVGGFWSFESFEHSENDDIEIDTIRHQHFIISFEEDGAFEVDGIVNNCRGTYKIKNGLQIDDLGCTLMASLDSLDNVLETRFMNAITSVKTFHIIEEDLTIQYEVEGDTMNVLRFARFANTPLQ